jgi:N-acetylmuramoyl-L-alanine amidase
MRRFNVAASALALGLATGLWAGISETSAGQHDDECHPRDFKIALDVGHTVEAPGATSARGVREYEFNLRLTKEIAKTLNDAGFQTHLVIVQGDKRAEQLFKRVQRANALGADLFVSIHHNDVQDRYKEKWMYEGESRFYSDRFTGHSLFVSRENPKLAQSLAFGRRLGIALNDQGLIYTNHHLEDVAGERRKLLDPEAGVYRYDKLFVLMHTKMPAVLLEAGIIVNRAEELLLETPEHRDRIARAMLVAAIDFCGVQQVGKMTRDLMKRDMAPARGASRKPI